jgi:hypothetical protein
MLLRLTSIDRKTAFFARMPAGVVEMANVAAHYGREPEPIMVVQTLRVALTVTAAPLFVVHFVSTGTRQALAQAATMRWPMLSHADRGGDGEYLHAAARAQPLVSRFAHRRSYTWRAWYHGRTGAGHATNCGPSGEGISLGTQFRHEFLIKLFGPMRSAAVTVAFAILVMVP